KSDFIFDLINSCTSISKIRLSKSVVECVMDDVCTHSKCFLPHFSRIVVHFRILPSVAQIGFVSVHQNKSFFNEDSECLRPLAVVLMDFRNSTRKGIRLLEYLMIRGNFHQRIIGKNALDLTSDILIHSVVVVNMKKSAAFQVIPQILDFRI